MLNRFLTVGVAGMGLLGFQQAVSAATVGLWLFDSFTDVTPAPSEEEEDPAGGETLLDSSGNALNLVATTNFGTVGLTSNRPGVMPAGTSALDSQVGGAGVYNTPADSRLSRGSTGEQTIEFWFNYTRPSTAYVLSFNGGNGGTYAGDWGIYGTPGGALNYFDYSSGFPEVSTGALTPGWHHIAFTIDLTGNMTAYVDGEKKAENLGTRAPLAATADVLKFGRSTDDGNSLANHDFLIDELRISDVALLPGAGTGQGELAYAVSLAPVPEPTSVIALASAAGAMLMARRRGR